MTVRARVVCAVLLAASAPAGAAAPSPIPFQTHAAFFSAASRQAPRIDPQVFVADPAALAGTGPQGIRHRAGIRPARIDSDPPGAPLDNADGQPLGATLGEWLGATGEMTLTPRAGGGETVAARFHGLRPDAEYSLFDDNLASTEAGITPLDGSGQKNSFRSDANGGGAISVVAPTVLTHANAVLLVYHSDGQTHGRIRGEIGVGAEHQLIARPP